MGGWDYYCFVCAAGFHVPSEYEGEENDDDDDDEDDSQNEHQDLPKALRPNALFSKYVFRDRLQWLSKFRTIGQNRNATGLTQCYLSGPASEQEYGEVQIQNGEHPNARNLTDPYASCYRKGDEETGDLPVHDSCFAILCKVFAKAQGIDYRWTADSDSKFFPFELDALFSCLASVREEYAGYLHLNHTFEPDQYFWVDRKRIYDYFDPLECGQIQPSDADVVDPDTAKTASQRRTASLFDALPNELLVHILDCISQTDLVSLIKASGTIRTATKPNKFWQRRLRLDAPWLSSFEGIQSSSSFDWQDYYRSVMMQVHKPFEVAARGSHVSGLANRKRIWQVGEQILHLYLETNTLQHRQEETPIFGEHVVCQYLPAVANQDKPQFRSDTAFFFNDQDEMQSMKHLRLKWTDDGALCGISLTTGATEVTFGEPGHSQSSESTVDFQPNDWIERLVLNISVIKSWTTPMPPYGEKSHCRLAVTGIRIWHLAGNVTVLGKDEGYKRLLEPLPGNGIVGLKTQFAEGKFTHLGLLEHPAGLTRLRPENDFHRLSLLWHDLPSADLRYKQYYSGYWMSQTGWDMVPMQTLLFGSTDLEQSTMTGFGVSADLRCFEICRLNGSHDRVGLQGSPMKVFNVDGPGGERIAGFEMTIGALPVGLTLRTTHGRQAVFGRRADNARHCHTSEHGLGVAGLYCSFGYNSARENMLSSLGLVLSPHIERSPMDEHLLMDGSGVLWEPRLPPSSWNTVGQVYGTKHQGEVAVCIDFSRPVSKIEGLFPAPEWLAEIEVGGFRIFHGDGDPLEPMSHFGFSPQQWPDQANATPEALRAMQRYPGMARGGGKDADTGKAHVASDEEALDQPKTWCLGEPGEKIVSVAVWAGDYLHGLQFHSETGKHSPRWGKCGAEPSTTIYAGGQEQIAGLKVILGSRRLSYLAGTLSPQAVQAMSAA